MKYNFILSNVLYQQRGVAFFYDRFFFFKQIQLKKNLNKRFFVAPRFVYPTPSFSLLLAGAAKGFVCVSSQTFSFLFYKLVFEILGGFAANVYLFLQNNQHVSSEVALNFSLLFKQRFPTYNTKKSMFCNYRLSLFNFLNYSVFLLNAMVSSVNPVYTIQSFLYEVKQHTLGFYFVGARLDSISYLKWFDLIQGLFTSLFTQINFSLLYSPWFLLQYQKFFGNTVIDYKIITIRLLFSSCIGIHPKYFDYTKILSGLSFRVVYKNKINLRCLL